MTPLSVGTATDAAVCTGRHKLAVALAFLVRAIVVGGALVLSRYRHARDTEAAIDSIAVLFFENQNRDPNIDYLSEGVTESIMNNLAQLPNLRVSPRSSVFRYRGKEIDALAIGKERGVRAVLTGRLDMAKLYLGLSKSEQAFEWLGKACEERSIKLTWFMRDPALDKLRSDLRFKDLLRRVGLTH